MPTDPPNFDDPALKGAVRSAWGKQRAPDTLRRTVMAAVIAARPAAPVTPKMKWLGKQPLYKIAAAVMVSLGVVSLAYQGYRIKHPYRAHTLVVEHLPKAVIQTLSANHDQLLKEPTSNLPLNDPAKMNASLQSKLPYPPLTAPVGGGFALVSATFGPVGSSQGLHLLYQRGPQAVSVFTLPSSAAPTCSADATINGGTSSHPIAGFTHAGAFYALVGSSSDNSLTSGDLQSMRSNLRATIPGAGCPDD